jgi:hypothetical protein
MTTLYSAARSAGRVDQDAPKGAKRPWAPQPTTHRIDWLAIRAATRSCCCSARPRVVVIMPPAPGRAHRTEVLFCMHHFRTSRSALTCIGAVALDIEGRTIAQDAPAYLIETG